MGNREKVEAVTDFLFLGSKITVDGDNNCSLEESCDKPRQHINKQRHHFVVMYVYKVCMVKATVFPRVIYRCDSWTIKKAEH